MHKYAWFNLRTVSFFWITIAIIAFNLIVHKYYAFISTYKMAPSSPKMVKDSHMVWVDCEMTGLDTSKDHLLEIAVIVTDKDLNILAEGPDLVIHQTDEVCNSEAKPVRFSKWPDSAHCRHMHLYPNFFLTSCQKSNYVKGQIVSKELFGVLEFSQKTNERIRHSSKNEFVRSFFGKIRG